MKAMEGIFLTSKELKQTMIDRLIVVGIRFLVEILHWNCCAREGEVSPEVNSIPELALGNQIPAAFYAIACFFNEL